LSVDLFLPHKARLLHLSGITPGLSPNLAVTAQRALNLAREAGWLVSFDLNYRHQIWSPTAALAGCTPFLQETDILLAPLGDVCLLYGLTPEIGPQPALDWLRERYPQATIVLTLGKEGAIGCEPHGPVLQQPAFPAEEVGRLGGGDAFAAGFLYRYLTAAEAEARLAQALLWGVAMAALKYTIPGDIPCLSRAEVESLVQQGTSGSKLVR
jgi:2-dehydro-3-deoxygluconokinase